MRLPAQLDWRYATPGSPDGKPGRDDWVLIVGITPNSTGGLATVIDERGRVHFLAADTLVIQPDAEFQVQPLVTRVRAG